MNRKTNDEPLSAHLRQIKQLIKKQQLLQAKSQCQFALERYPHHPQLSQLLLNIFYQKREFEPLIEQFNEQQSLFVNSASAVSLYANALRYCQQGEKAIQVLEDYLVINPDNYHIFNQLGLINKELGKNAKAIEAFEQCLKIESRFCPAYWYKSSLTKQLNSEELSVVTKILSSPNVNSRDEVFLRYALFFHYDSLKDYDSAINHLHQGAKVQRKNLNYSHTDACAEYGKIINTFTTDYLGNNELSQQIETALSQQLGSDIKPIFIVGMPRCGSSLVEQIIASHSLVTGGDESHDFVRATEMVLAERQISKAYPDWLSDMDRSAIKSVIKYYLQLTSRLQKTPYFTDKTLFNYKALGLILLAFPNAKIINCVRDPLDNIFGCYKQLFANGLGFTYNLEELADHFIEYEKLMSHWRELFGERIFTLQYEHLISDQLNTTQELLNFIDLPFEENCLEFYSNKRSVHTLSANQVKKPLYRSAIGSWKNYESAMTKVREKLKR